MKKNPVSIEAIKLIAKSLGELNEKAVFVGGSIVPFYLPDEMLAVARPTEDIDVVFEMISTAERVNAESKLRVKGFTHDRSEGAPICRWKFKGITVDMMTPNEKVFGFCNKWYAGGIKNSLQFSMQPDLKIRILSLPYFIATKLEAFKGRGKNDFQASHDMEDIISVFDAATEDHLEGKAESLDSEITKYLKNELSQLLNNNDFNDAIVGAVFDRQNAHKRAEAVIKRINNIVTVL